MLRTVAALSFVLLAVPATAAPGPVPGDVAVLQLADSHNVRFTLITPHGYVGFDANATWPVLAMQTQPPVSVAAFQIPDSADDGSPVSTNLAISLYQKDSPQGAEALASAEQKFEMYTISTENHGDWTVHVRRTSQDGMSFIMLDAEAPRADMVCGVRLAWPQLDSHASNYDGQMKALFLATLDSIQGKTGTYATHQGEVVRRPN